MSVMLSFHHNKHDSETWINVSNRTIIRVVVVAVLAFLLLSALKRATHAIILISTAFFLALALNAPVHWLSEHIPGKRRGSRGLATAVSFLLVIVVLGTFLASIIPPLARQTGDFIKEAPHIVQETRDQNSNLGKLIRKYHLQDQVTTFSQQLKNRLKNVTGTAVSTVTELATSIFSVVAILVMTFMMLIEGPYWLGRFNKLLSPEHSRHANELGEGMYHVVKGFVNGQVLLAVIATALITPMLFILHISYPLALMVVIFSAALIPLIGHSIGAFIITLVALFHSPWAALIILIYYIFYMQIENYIIQPRIQANTTNLSPMLVFMSIVVGVSFGGLLGGLVAIPVMGCLRVIIVDYLKNHGKYTPTTSIE
jgi:predicted PurR-regulated permease PerM